MADSESVYQQLSIASWQVGTEDRIRFPVLEITDTQRNRIVQHERPYREGAKLDDTGSAVREFAMRAYFSNDVREPGLDASEPLFPEALRRLQQSMEVHETGRLEVPTIGVVFCRAVSCVRRDSPDMPSGPIVDLVFQQDNQDALDRALVEPPTVKGSIPALAEQTRFSAQASGTWDEAWAEVEDRIAELETALGSPGRATNQVQTIARRNRRIQARMVRRATAFARSVDGAFASPEGSQTERQALLLRDRQAEAVAERSRSLPATREFVVDVPQTSMFELAARFDTDVEDLLSLNDGLIATPFVLRRGDVVRLFVTAPA